MENNELTEQEIEEIEHLQDKREVKLIVKAVIYGSFFLVLFTTINVIIGAIWGF